jgi:hypothetical protein
MSSAGRGCYRHINGILWRGRSSQPEAIFFAGAILRDYCEHDHSLGFELHKRMSAVMMRRLQAARKKMLAIHAHGDKLGPVGLSPFMEQEFDTDGYVDPDEEEATEGLPVETQTRTK